MHCVTLADLAASLAQHGPSMMEIRPAVSNQAIMRYWTASRSRHERWHAAMGDYRDAQNRGQFSELASWWKQHLVVLEEILVSELLARIVATLGTELFDVNRQKHRDDYESLAVVADGVYLSQIEASNRVAKIILESAGSRVEDTVRLNRLRYGVERWTDWLVGRASIDGNCDFEYAIDAERSRSFCNEIRESVAVSHRDTTTWLMNAAMRDMLVRRTSPQSAFPDANHKVATAALALFQPELFDSFGVPKSTWLQRIQRDTSVSQST